MYIYVDGEVIEQSNAKISPFDHGFLYGIGLFETIRTYNGVPFLLKEHIERLNNGLEQLHISCPFAVTEYETIIQKLCEKNEINDSYIRINVSAGNGEIGLQVAPYENPTVIIFQKPLAKMKRLAEKEAVLLNIRRNTPEMSERLKSHHFLNNIAAKREVGTDMNKEGIFLTAEGFIAEGVTSNIFWIKDEHLYTPSLETGILNGITRQFIMKLAAELRLHVYEGLYKVDVLYEADEVFFTNSIQEIVPVTQLGTKQYPGKDGHKTVQLYELYEKYIKMGLR